MGYVKGDWIRFYNDGVQLDLEMETTLTVGMGTIPTTDKDSSGWETFTDGDKNWTSSGTANLDWSATENASTFFANLIAGSSIAVDVGSANDTKFYSGNGLLTELSLEGPRNGLATFSYSVQGTGALSEGTTT